MSRVIVVGAGDFGREVAAWARDDSQFLRSDQVWFIDDNSGALGGYPSLSERLLGPITGFIPNHDDRLLLGISDPTTKRSLVAAMQEVGLSFTTYIHSSVLVADSAQIGQGSILCPNVIVSSDAKVGKAVTLNLGVTVGHDAVVGDYSSLMSHVDVTGFVSVGEGCFLGSHATVIPHVTVEAGAIVGAGSVVIRRVRQHSTVFGIPARQVSRSRPLRAD